MPLSCGVVGLPNAGKSTLFNALTQAGAQVAGYPFCTVDRNVGTTLVPDERLADVKRFAGSAAETPTSIEVVDIAGLVRGASRGEGLGNRFLGHIREVDAILHVVRCYDNPSAPHFLGDIDPVRDVGIVAAELMLADLATVERRRDRVRTPARTGDTQAKAALAALDALTALLDRGVETRHGGLPAETMELARSLSLLTAKPSVLVANVPDPGASGDGGAEAARWRQSLRELAASQGDGYAEIYARALADLGELGPDRDAMAAEFGVSLSPLANLITEAYRALDLITFFTANRSEARAWTLRRGSDAVTAAGKVHTDFARGFIAAEVLPAGAYRAYADRNEAHRAGAMRLEGRDYVVRDGDLLEFRFSV